MAQRPVLWRAASLAFLAIPVVVWVLGTFADDPFAGVPAAAAGPLPPAVLPTTYAIVAIWGVAFLFCLLRAIRAVPTKDGP